MNATASGGLILFFIELGKQASPHYWCEDEKQPASRPGMIAILFAISMMLATATISRAQSAPNIVNPLNATGVMPYGTYDGVMENISLVGGNLNIHLPLLSLPQRGGKPFTIGIVYDSKIFSLQPFVIPNTGNWTISWIQDFHQIHALQYWRYSFPSLTAMWQVNGTSTICNAAGCVTQYVSCLSSFIYTDQSGAKHSFANRTNCDPLGNATAHNVFVSDANDSSFMRLNTTTTGDFVVTEKDGTTIHFQSGWSTTSTTPGNLAFDKIVDTNGNKINVSSGNCAYSCALTDTVGRVITIAPGKIGYNDVNGNPQQVTFNSGSNIAGPTLTLAGSTFFATNGPVNGPGPYQGTSGNYTDSVTIPNGLTGLTYTFTYDSLGELIKIQYPSGGYTRYDYNVFHVAWSNADGSLHSQQVDFREVTAKHECRNAGGNCTSGQEDNTTYTPTLGASANSAMDVLDPLQNKTHVDFGGDANREINRLVYSGQSTLLRTIKTTYTESVPKGYSLPTEIDTTLDNGQTTKKTISYFPIALSQCAQEDFNGPVDPCPASIDNPHVTTEYGFDGSVLRTTTQQYASGPSPALGDVNVDHILDRLTDSVVSDGTNTFETQYEYDNYTEGLSASGAAQYQGAGVRGNITAIKKMLNGSALTTRYQYDDAGNVVKATDPLLNSTLYSYTDSFAEGSCRPSSGTAAVYPTTITNALSQTTTSTWNSCNGSVSSITDANKNKTTYTYDPLGRLTQVSYPDNGSTSNAYIDTPPRTITKTVVATPNPSIISTTVLDGLARVSQTQLNSDPAGVDYVDTTYDPLGRKATVSNPYRTTTDPTYGITTYQYDALGRVTQVAQQDGSTVVNTYTGRATQVQDQGNGTSRATRIAQVDGLGRLISVCEVTGVTQANGNAPSACGQDIGATGFLTTYQYNAVGNLTAVAQGGIARSFAYDSLARLLTATNPESGTTAYTYDANGNVLTRTRPAPNQSSPAVTVTTTYEYDPLNRLTSTTYSDSVTPSILRHYDTSSELGHGLLNTIGRLSAEYVTSPGQLASGRVFSYDPMGRVVDNSQCVPQSCPSSTVYALNYVYDLMGDEGSATNGQGVKFTYAYDGAGHMTSMASSLADANHPGTLLSGTAYNALGNLTAASVGGILSEALAYDCRQRMVSYGSAVLPTTASAPTVTTSGCPVAAAWGVGPKTPGMLAGSFLSNRWPMDFQSPLLAGLDGLPLRPRDTRPKELLGKGSGNTTSTASAIVLSRGITTDKREHGSITIDVRGSSHAAHTASIKYGAKDSSAKIARMLLKQFNKQHDSWLKAKMGRSGPEVRLELLSRDKTALLVSARVDSDRPAASVLVKVLPINKVPSDVLTSAQRRAEASQ